MSKRYTQAERVMWGIVNGYEHFAKGKGLELKRNDTGYYILYNNNIVGRTIDSKSFDTYEYDPDSDNYLNENIVMLTLQDYMLPERVRKSLVIAANQNELLVVFAPILDIGFGLPEPMYLSAHSLKKLLSKVAKYSQDDVKTAAIVGDGYYGVHYTEYCPQLLTCNQLLEGHSDKYHAESTLVNALELEPDLCTNELYWLMDLEPCEDCLRAICETNSLYVGYLTPHKDKWNTEGYIQLVNDIDIKKIRNKRGFPIKYEKEVV